MEEEHCEMSNTHYIMVLTSSQYNPWIKHRFPAEPWLVNFHLPSWQLFLQLLWRAAFWYFLMCSKMGFKKWASTDTIRDMGFCIFPSTSLICGIPHPCVCLLMSTVDIVSNAEKKEGGESCQGEGECPGSWISRCLSFSLKFIWKAVTLLLIVKLLRDYICFFWWMKIV